VNAAESTITHSANNGLSDQAQCYEVLADLLEYPGAEWRSLIDLTPGGSPGHAPEVSAAFKNFKQEVLALSLSELQELYTRTFDLNPVCALEIGHHLFGENYKRGVFLANLRETEASYDLGQSRQLPDYLPVLLRLLTKLDDFELREALICECMLPALAKMLTAFADGENPFRYLIETARIALRLEVGERANESVVLKSRRTSLPVLTIDPGNQANLYGNAGPEFGGSSGEFLKDSPDGLKTNPDLF
jgi:nitrate reductase delta subunit